MLKLQFFVASGYFINHEKSINLRNGSVTSFVLSPSESEEITFGRISKILDEKCSLRVPKFMNQIESMIEVSLQCRQSHTERGWGRCVGKGVVRVTD